jgi:hypothetical protein
MPRRSPGETRPQKKCPKGPSGRADPIPFFFVFFVAFCGGEQKETKETEYNGEGFEFAVRGISIPQLF